MRYKFNTKKQKIWKLHINSFDSISHYADDLKAFLQTFNGY